MTFGLGQAGVLVGTKGHNGLQGASLALPHMPLWDPQVTPNRVVSPHKCGYTASDPSAHDPPRGLATRRAPPSHRHNNIKGKHRGKLKIKN